MTLARHTPLRRTAGPARTSTLNRRSSPRASSPERDWRDARAKVDREHCCRVCAELVPGPFQIEAAHTIGREHDRPKSHPDFPGFEGPLWVDPLDVVPLCPAHHRAYDGRRLDLLPHLTKAEQARAVSHIGLIAALHRLTGNRT